MSDLARDMLRLHSFLMDIPKALLEHTAGNSYLCCVVHIVVEQCSDVKRSDLVADVARAELRLQH